MIDSETFGFMVTDIARMTRAMLEKRIASAGLGITPGEARALLHIAALEGARQSQIAERLGIEPMTACVYIDKLEKQGLVTRAPDPDDRRAKNVVATETAKILIDRILEQTAAIREQSFAGLAPAERDTMMEALKRVRANLYGLLTSETAEVDPQ